MAFLHRHQPAIYSSETAGPQPPEPGNPVLASAPESAHTDAMRIVSRLLVALVILLAIYITFVRLEANAWLFHPAPYPGGDWSVQHIYRAQNEWIPYGKSRLDAWLVPALDPQRTVLFFHARLGNISDEEEHILRLRDLHSDTLLVDYPGYGKSPGRPRIADLNGVAEASYDFLTQTLHVPPDHIILQGDELGTALAAHLAAAHPQVAGLVLESPFPDLKHLADAVMPMAGWFISGNMDEIRDIHSYPGPVMVLYGSADPNLPAKFGEEVAKAASGPKVVHVVNGGTQALLILQAGDDYSTWMADFYRTTHTLEQEAKPAQEALPMVPIRR